MLPYRLGMIPKFMKRFISGGLVLLLTVAVATTSFAAGSLPAVKDLPAHPEMPDPLMTQAGEKVTTPEQWQHRREEMKRLMEEFVYGHMPPPPGNVTGHGIRSSRL